MIALMACVVVAIIGAAAIGVGIWSAANRGTQPEAPLVEATAPTADREPDQLSGPVHPSPATDTADDTTASATAVVGDLGEYGEVRSLSAPDVATRIDPVWVAEAAEALGIPERALAAYAGASNAANAHYPECGLGWNTLAAIGHVESEHGQIHGGEIGDDGVATPGIVGIALTGAGTAVHRDTDGGVLDGDLSWDRAVGPMQFIPSTWLLYAADGNGDGVADPQNIDDAALAAAAYLCDVGGNLRVGANFIRALSAYNASVEYNNRVASAANHYAAAAP